MGFLGLFGSGKAKSEGKGSKEVSLSPFASIEGRVISAFTRVKQDITLLGSWVKYLKHKDLLSEHRHTKVQRELGEHKMQIAALKEEATELKTAFREMREELKAARERHAVPETGPFPDLIRTKSGPNPDLKRTYFENRVVSMLRSRKKDYVLKQICELAAKGTHSTSEIEEIVVGEKAMCGRTAFFDYLRELKHKKIIMEGERGAKKVIMPVEGGLEQV